MSSIMSMSSMVSSSLLMNVELLEPVSMALSSEVCELQEGKNKKAYSPHTDQPHMVVEFPGWPPKGKGALPARFFGIQIWATQFGKILPPSQTAAHHASPCSGPGGKQDPQVSFTLQLSFSSVKSFIRVANKLQQFLLSLLDPRGRENGQCLNKKQGKKKQRDRISGILQPGQSPAPPETSCVQTMLSGCPAPLLECLYSSLSRERSLLTRVVAEGGHSRARKPQV